MFEYYLQDRNKHTDLNMYFCGEEACASNHFWGPGVRDCFLIHYIYKGKGIFQINNKTYHLQEGQGFLILPNALTYYQADATYPWHYYWIGFHGLKAEYYLKQANLDAQNPVFTYAEDHALLDCIQKMLTSENASKSRDLYLLSLLYLFLSKLIETSETNPTHVNENQKEIYVKKAIELIESKYTQEVTISEIAKLIGIDRSYLCAIFKKYMNISPQQFLLSYRLSKACELMENKNLSIGDISRSVGYSDPLQFSKVFKKNERCITQGVYQKYSIDRDVDPRSCLVLYIVFY